MAKVNSKEELLKIIHMTENDADLNHLDVSV